MNIWFVTHIKNDSYGGVGKSVYELSNGLKLIGHHVLKYYQTDSWIDNNYMLFSLRIAISLLLTKEKPDWIISRSSDGFFIVLLCKLFFPTIKTVLYNHGWEEYVFAEEKKLSKKSISNPTTIFSHLIRFPVLRACLKLHTIVICGTLHETKKLRLQYTSSASKIHFLGNGTTPQDRLPIKKQYRQIQFLHICNLSWKKNSSMAFKLFAEIRKKKSNIHMTCIGLSLADVKKRFGVSLDTSFITFVPTVKFSDMKLYYQNHTYIISTSRYEGGHSLALLEAMGFGCIPIITPIFSSCEIINHKKTGYIINRDYYCNDIEKLMLFFENGDQNHMQKKCIRKAMRNSWDLQIARLERLLCQQ